MLFKEQQNNTYDDRRAQIYTVISTDHGTMIVNRYDFKTVGNRNPFGIGYQLFNEVDSLSSSN